MEFNSKFNLWDSVTAITLSKAPKFTQCDFCAGAGIVVGANQKESSCPECYGRKGNIEYEETAWNISSYGRYLTIGRITIQQDKKEYREVYMCNETGIGSGTLWSGDILFSTVGEAQQVCDERNKELNAQAELKVLQEK